MLLLILESLGTTEIIVILLGLILLLPAIIIVFVVLAFSKKQRVNLKKCAFCAESIQPEAIVCRFCGKDLPKI